MKDNAETASSPSASLQSALLDYFSAPGKYQLTLRQPAVLFSSIREILQIAAGRGANGAAAAADAGELREAAMFFIRAALLYPGADHYAVLGVPPNTDASDLKERYRLLMRLIHPDFATAGAMEWPADAAVRVNRAYEVLSSSVLRREYDEQLAALKQQRPSLAAKAPPHVTAATMRRAERVPARMGRKAGWALGLLLAGLATFLLLPRQEPDHLVQRPTANPIPLERVAEARLQAGKPAEQTAAIAGDQLPSAPVDHATEHHHQQAVETPTPAAATPVAPEAVPLPPIVAPPAAVQVVPPRPQPAPAPAIQPPVVAKTTPPVPANVAARPLPLGHPAKATDRLPQAAAVRPPDSLSTRSTLGEQATVPPPAPLPPPVIASVPTPPPPPVPVQQAPVVIAATASSAMPTAKATATLAVSTVPSPTLSEAQPLLTQVLQMLETGSGDQLLRLLDPKARQAPAAQELSRSFEQMVRGARPVRLSQVEFKGEPHDGVLLVTGRIRLHAGEPTIGSYGQKLVLRAEFASRGGHVMLTGLSGSPD